MAAILAGAILTTREISYVDEIGAQIHFAQCRGAMSALVLVEAIGDIEIDIDEAPPEQTVLRLPVAAQSGAAFTLQLRRREILSAVRHQKPAAFGVQ